MSFAASEVPRAESMRLLLLALALGLSWAQNCSDSACSLRCHEATPGDQLCSGATCDEVLGRCDCADAVLGMNGSCIPIAQGLPAGSCAISSDVTFTAAITSGPEITQADAQSGIPSSKLKSMILSCTARALGVPEFAVLIMNTKLHSNFKASSVSTKGASGSKAVLQLDLSYSFCANEAVTLDASRFEDLWILGAEQFAVFLYASFQLLNLVPHGVNASSVKLPLVPTVVSQQPLSDGSSLRGSASAKEGSGSGLWWLPWVLSLLAVMLAVAIIAHQWIRRQGSGSGMDVLGAQYMPEQLVCPDGTVLNWLAEGSGGAFVLAIEDFNPSDLGQEMSHTGLLLPLQEGKVVEVEASGGIWLYGTLTEDPEKFGFFPLSYVAWLGRPLQDSPPANTLGRAVAGLRDWSPPCSPQYADRNGDLLLADDAEVVIAMAGTPHRRSLQPQSAELCCLKVRAALAFSPSEVEGSNLPPEQCLHLKGGELVEVMAAGAGWLYGRLALKPEIMGYFPEDRAAWQTADLDVAASQTPEGQEAKQDQLQASPGQ